MPANSAVTVTGLVHVFATMAAKHPPRASAMQAGVTLKKSHPIVLLFSVAAVQAGTHAPLGLQPWSGGQA